MSDDHTTPMTESWASTLESIQAGVRAQEADDEGRDRDDEQDSTLDELVLCVDTEIVRDVMLSVGGPTRFVRFIFSADSSDFGAEYASISDVKRVEYHDSWGANGVTSITLNEDESEQMVAAFGYMVGIES